MAIVSNVHVYAALMDHAADLFRQADTVIVRLVLVLNDRAATLLDVGQQLHGVGTLQGKPEVTVFVGQRVGQGGSHVYFASPSFAATFSTSGRETRFLAVLGGEDAADRWRSTAAHRIH
jgi:hypothetical protein